jgi:leucyl aminopeptidase
MFLHSPLNKSKIDIEFNVSIDKQAIKNNIHIDIDKPFTSVKERCADIKSLSKNKGNVLIDITKLPASLKTVFTTYLTKELYSFLKYKHNNEKSNKQQNKETKYYIEDRTANKNDIDNMLYTIQCVNIARDLQNEPANLLSPDVFCKRAKGLLQSKATFQVLNVKEMEKEGLNLVLAIGKSSLRPPRFLIAELITDKDYPTICIIGKTVIYDAGGLNIKFKGMTPEMKTDKEGGCVAISILKYFAKYPCKCNLVVICPVVENLLSQDVPRPGDIIKAHNGKMVEITDTDAEGRLILADALSFSTKYNPKYVIDFATLTGWADSVHPDLNAVCWTKDMSIAAVVNEIGERVGERVWFLPPWDEYMNIAKSTVANVTNDTDKIQTGAYFPVMFMLHFLPDNLKSKYIHFDICHNWTNNLAKGNCVQLGIELVKHLSIATQ